MQINVTDSSPGCDKGALTETRSTVGMSSSSCDSATAVHGGGSTPVCGEISPSDSSSQQQHQQPHPNDESTEQLQTNGIITTTAAETTPETSVNKDDDDGETEQQTTEKYSGQIGKLDRVQICWHCSSVNRFFVQISLISIRNAAHFCSVELLTGRRQTDN